MVQIAAAALLALVPAVYGHGKILTPPPREPGPAMEAVCGQQVYDNQAANDQGNSQNELQIALTQSDYNAAECNLFLCKGYQFADNSANVQTFSPGQVVPMTAVISAPHTGTCNVSVVNTQTNTMISQELIYFSDYASNAHTIPPNNTAFSVTIPTDLGDQCNTAGVCALQWWWNAASIDQTYESCVDFVLSGSARASGSAAASAGVASASQAIATATTDSTPASTAEASTSSGVISSSGTDPCGQAALGKSSSLCNATRCKWANRLSARRHPRDLGRRTYFDIDDEYEEEEE